MASPDALVTAIGAISGTSMDGVDVALVRTDGDLHVEPGAGRTYPYPAELRDQLIALLADPERAARETLADLEAAVTDVHAGAVARFMAEEGLVPGDVTLVGLHGQTVLHRPERRYTRQLGDGARAARILGVPVVNRFRHADVAAGGEGAPLVPLYHRALAARLPQPLAILNLGGVANVTWLDGEEVLAFDSGPASAMLDDFVLGRTGKPFDEGGRLAGSGRAHPGMVRAFMDNPFFDRKPPKSLDRQDFHERGMVADALGDADGAATIAAFTVESTAATLRHLPRPPLRWLITGGGRLNETFMRGFRQRLAVPVDPVEAVGWDGNALEAQCFAYLAVRSRRGLPITLPTTTGVSAPTPGGDYWPV